MYADIDVNTEWLETAMANDADHYECLVEEQNDCDEQPIVDSNNCVHSTVTANVAITSPC